MNMIMIMNMNMTRHKMTILMIDHMRWFMVLLPFMGCALLLYRTLSMNAQAQLDVSDASPACGWTCGADFVGYWSHFSPTFPRGDVSGPAAARCFFCWLEYMEAPEGEAAQAPALAGESSAPSVYMSVKDAISEQAHVKLQHRLNAPRIVRMPPDWGSLHRKEELSQSHHGPRAGPPPKGQTFVTRANLNKKADSLHQTSTFSQASVTSSVAHHLREGPDPTRASTVGPGWLPGSHGVPGEKPGSPAASGYGVMPRLGARVALGGSSKSGLNHPSTYFYGEAPIKPELSNNMYNSVGSYSMLGSQANSKLASSAAYGFGTATRQQMMNTYARTIAAESTHANARVPVRRRLMASCVACTPPRPFIRPHAPSPHASLVLPLCSPTLVRLPLPPARPSQVHITSPPEGVRRQVLAQPEHLHSAELPRPPDPRLEALLPVSFLWPRGALRRRSPRPARDDNAGPRLVPCLTRCTARRPDTFIASSYSQHALAFSSV